MNLPLSRRSLAWRWSLALVCIAVAGGAHGCGSSQEQQGNMGAANAAKLPEEKLYKYVGEGKNKRKEPISIRERAKLLHEAEKKSQ